MRIKKKKLFKTLKQLAYAGFIIFVCLSIFLIGEIYGKYSKDETILEFFTKKTQYEWGAFEGAPVELEIQVEKYNRIVNNIHIALLFILFFFVFDYFVEPETHFITLLKNKLAPIFKKIGSKIEEDELDVPFSDSYADVRRDSQKDTK